MIPVLRGLLRGAAAGAAGTTALNAVTEADMALRGRPASGTPAAVVSRLADLAGLEIPGEKQERDNRLDGLGALSGGVTGVAVGALAGCLRAAGVRLPTAVGGPLLGAAAMAAADLPISRLGISDPRTWSGADWASDAIPHLVYGVTAHATLTALYRREETEPAVTPKRPPRSALLRAAALGAATGCRSSAGLTALALASRRGDAGLSGRLARPSVKSLNMLFTAAELGFDKSPAIPSRLSRQGLPPRIAMAAVAARAVARRDGFRSGSPALLAGLAATAAAAAGHQLRAVSARRLGSDLPGAFIEDAVAVALGRLGTLHAAR